MTPRAGRRHALGQHFLVDPDLAAAIVEAVGPTTDDLVLEIGAGTGALTRLLTPRAGRLIALELDPALHERLRAELGQGPRLAVRLGDARTFSYQTLAGERPTPGGRVLVVGNLPYSASKAILERLWAARSALDLLVLMLQREVAERLVAPPGSRASGALSVIWQLWLDVELLLVVPRTAFRPPPAVESALIRARPRREPRVPIGDFSVLLRVVKAGFAQRRKTLANALRPVRPGPPDVRAALEAAGIHPERRAETLTLAEWARLEGFFGRRETA